MPPDSHKISLKIIEAIKQHPVLYITDVKGITIKLQEFRQKVWKRISDELGLDPGWVRLRWKNLRDTYCRILKYKNKTEKGVRRKKWIFEDHLSFLKFPYESDYQPQCVELTDEYIQEINSGGISSEGLLEQLEDRNDEDYSEYLEVLEETTADPILNESQIVEPLQTSSQPIVQQLENETTHPQHLEMSNFTPTQTKYKKIRPKRMKYEQQIPMDVSNSYSILKNSNIGVSNPNISATDTSLVSNSIFLTNPAIISTTTSPVKGINDLKLGEGNVDQMYLAPEGKTGIELFFDSMAETVKRLPHKAQADIKMDICKIITEAEVKYSGRNRPQSTQQFITPPGMIPKLVLIPCNMIDNQNSKS